MLPTVTDNRITSTRLHSHLETKLGTKDYIEFWNDLQTILQWYVDRNTDEFHTFAFIPYTVDSLPVLDLTENMCRIYISSLNDIVAVEVLRDLDYLFNGVKAVQYLQGLHQQYAPAPTIDTETYEVDSLEFVEIVNKGRIEWNAQNPTLKPKPMLLHLNVLNTIRRVMGQIPRNLSYLDYRMCESTYLNSQNKPQAKILMSSDLALGVGMAYEPAARMAVQNEMNRLHAYIVQTPVIITPVLPTMAELQPHQPVSDNDTMISQARAEEITGITMDKALLVATTINHGYNVEEYSVDGVMTNTYHSFVYAAAYNIPVNTWTSVITRHIIN